MTKNQRALYEHIAKAHGIRLLKEEDIVAPQVNLNGTDVHSLLDVWQEAYSAVGTAIEALAHASPHPRDFQTAAPGTYQMAKRQHDQRLRMLQQIRQELETIVSNLLDQQEERERRRR